MKINQRFIGLLLLGTSVWVLPACADDEDDAPADASETGDEDPAGDGDGDGPPGDGDGDAGDGDGDGDAGDGNGDAGDGDAGDGDAGDGEGEGDAGDGDGDAGDGDGDAGDGDGDPIDPEAEAEPWGDPEVGCIETEQSVDFEGYAGSWCGAVCDTFGLGEACSAIPEGATAWPACIGEGLLPGPGSCVMGCTLDGDDCPGDMSCEAGPFGGICSHPRV